MNFLPDSATEQVSAKFHAFGILLHLLLFLIND